MCRPAVTIRFCQNWVSTWAAVAAVAWQIGFNEAQSAEAEVLDLSMKAAVAIAMLAGLLSVGEASAHTQPSYGGTKPNLGLRLGEPENFQVVPPLGHPEGQWFNGDTDILIWQNLSEGYKLDTSIPLPSSWPGVGQYKLDISTTDGEGKPATRSLDIQYEPPIVGVATATDNVLRIPSVTHSFPDGQGRRALTTASMIGSDGEVLKATHGVFASLSPDATVSLLVNGVLVKPGDTNIPLGTYNFGAAGGVLAMNLASGVSGSAGQGRLLLVTDAPTTPQVIVDVVTWVPKVDIVADAWTVEQAFDVANVRMEEANDNPCPLTLKGQQSSQSDKLNSPVCLLEFDPRPADLLPREDGSLALYGRMWSPGQHRVGYKVYLLTSGTAPTKILAAYGEKTLNVVSTQIVLGYQETRDNVEAFRVIEYLEASVKQTDGPSCETHADDGIDPRSTEGQFKCVLVWTELPRGLQQANWSATPMLAGSIQDLGRQWVKYDVFLVTMTGNRVLAYQGAFYWDAVNPAPPDLAESMLTQVGPNLYAVAADGGTAGSAVAEGARAEMLMSMEVGARVGEETRVRVWRGQARARGVRDIIADPSPIWTQTPVKFGAKYALMPDISASRQINLLTVPAAGVMPTLDLVDDEPVIPNITSFRVQADIRNVWRGTPYNQNLMGAWRVRIVNKLADGTFQPITEFQNATNGKATFDIDATALNIGYLTLYAEGEVLSPVAGYSRREYSPDPLVLSIVSGGELATDLTSQAMVGPTPFRVRIFAVLPNSFDMMAAGEVQWELSRDMGGSWEPIQTSYRSRFRFASTFYEAGRFLVRARVYNRFTNAVFTTVAKEVWTFDRLVTRMYGPYTAFIGADANFSNRVWLRGEEITASEDRYVMEWSEDRGVTWEAGPPTKSITNEEDGWRTLWVRTRLKDSPEFDGRAWALRRWAVRFREERPPVGGLWGPRSLEQGQTAKFGAVARPPYRGMDVQLNGHWILPNGEQPTDARIQYTPDGRDREAERIQMQYFAEILGFEHLNTTFQKNVSVWEYIWPKWTIETSKFVPYAPTTIQLRAGSDRRNPYLEGLTIDWTIPDGVTQLHTGSNWTTVRVDRPGSFEFTMRTRDARGNDTTVTRTIEILAPPQMNVDIRVYDSDKRNRAPLNIFVSSRMSGGHPQDRIDTFQTLLNGEAMESSWAILPAGNHTVRVEGLTLYGYGFAGEASVEVNENQKPTCEPQVNRAYSGWRYSARCLDADGTVRRWRWTINGIVQAVSTDRITASFSAFPVPPTASVIAIDDLGLESDPTPVDLGPVLSP